MTSVQACKYWQSLVSACGVFGSRSPDFSLRPSRARVSPPNGGHGGLSPSHQSPVEGSAVALTGPCTAEAFSMRGRAPWSSVLESANPSRQWRADVTLKGSIDTPSRVRQLRLLTGRSRSDQMRENLAMETSNRRKNAITDNAAIYRDGRPPCRSEHFLRKAPPRV